MKPDIVVPDVYRPAVVGLWAVRNVKSVIREREKVLGRLRVDDDKRTSSDFARWEVCDACLRACEGVEKSGGVGAETAAETVVEHDVKPATGTAAEREAGLGGDWDFVDRF